MERYDVFPLGRARHRAKAALSSDRRAGGGRPLAPCAAVWCPARMTWLTRGRIARLMTVASFVAAAACTTEDAGKRPDAGKGVASRPVTTGETPKPPAGKLSRAECEALWMKAREQENAFDQAHAGCARDADCVYPESIGCTRGCTPQVAKSALPEREAAARRIEANECAAWRAGGCAESAPMPVPSCIVLTPTCKDGRCRSSP